MNIKQIKQRSKLPDNIVQLLALYEEIETKINKTTDKSKINLGKLVLKGIKKRITRLGFENELKKSKN